jgi:hypothetical protein
MAKTDSALTDVAVRKFLTEVITAVEEAGGEFDGFVAEVVEEGADPRHSDDQKQPVGPTL